MATDTAHPLAAAIEATIRSSPGPETQPDTPMVYAPKIGGPAAERTSFARRMAAGYISGLCLIAAVALTTNFCADRVLTRQMTTAKIVNISGRQRMLSQRITGLALRMVLLSSHGKAGSPDPAAEAGVQAARHELRESIATMRASGFALLHGSSAMGLPAADDPAVLRIYNQPPYQLNHKTEDFLRHADHFAALPPSAIQRDNVDLAAMEQAAGGPLLDAIQSAVIANQLESENLVHSLHYLLIVITWLMLFVLLLEAIFIYRPMLRALAASQQALVDAARTDPLTGCLNRRAYLENAVEAFALGRRYATPLAVMMLDIDQFKRINDEHGHPSGDLVIRSIVATMLRMMRNTDRLGRMGGEEFAILLPHATAAQALLAADRLRVAIMEEGIHIEGSILHVTVSIGISAIAQPDGDFLTMLGRADKALYQAKHGGRNQARLAPSFAP